MFGVWCVCLCVVLFAVSFGHRWWMRERYVSAALLPMSDLGMLSKVLKLWWFPAAAAAVALLWSGLTDCRLPASISSP